MSNVVVIPSWGMITMITQQVEPPWGRDAVPRRQQATDPGDSIIPSTWLASIWPFSFHLIQSQSHWNIWSVASPYAGVGERGWSLPCRSSLRSPWTSLFGKGGWTAPRHSHNLKSHLVKKNLIHVIILILILHIIMDILSWLHSPRTRWSLAGVWKA